jgi:hypothetical protein
MPIKAFVHSLTSYKYFFKEDDKIARPSPSRIVLRWDHGRYKKEAEELLDN